MELWDELIAAYRTIDPVAVRSVTADLILSLLEVSDTRRYPQAVKRMKALKKDAAAADRPAIAEQFSAENRSEFRRRPSLIERMNRAGLV